MIESAFEHLDPEDPYDKAYADYFRTQIIDKTRRDPKAWTKAAGSPGLSRPAMSVLAKMRDHGGVIRRHDGGFWRVPGDDEYSAPLQSLRALEKKGLVEVGPGPEWKADRRLTESGTYWAQRYGAMRATVEMSLADQEYLRGVLTEAAELWRASASVLDPGEAQAFERLAAMAAKLSKDLGRSIVWAGGRCP
jgi:hypothetical protein